MRKRFYVEWINEDGDQELTPFWAIDPTDAVSQARDWLLGSVVRVLGVRGGWDAVIVDGRPMLRADWEARCEARERLRETAPTAALAADFFDSLFGARAA